MAKKAIKKTFIIQVDTINSQDTEDTIEHDVFNFVRNLGNCSWNSTDMTFHLVGEVRKD